MYRANFVVLLVAGLPMAIVGALVGSVSYGSFPFPSPQTAWWGWILQTCVNLFVGTALIHLAAQAFAEPDVAPHRRDRLFAVIVGRFWPVLVTAVLVVLCVGAGAVVFVVPGVVLLVWWSVALPVVVIEGGGAIGALRRSRALVRGRFWLAFRTGVLVCLLMLVGEMAVLILGLIPTVGRLLQLAAGAILVPYAMSVVVAFYHGLDAQASTPVQTMESGDSAQHARFGVCRPGISVQAGHPFRPDAGRGFRRHAGHFSAQSEMGGRHAEMSPVARPDNG